MVQSTVRIPANRPPKLVLIEPKPPGPHVFSKMKLPRLGAVLLGTIARDLGWEVRVYVEDIAPIDYQEAVNADVVGISTITTTAPRAYAIADALREQGVSVAMGGPHVTFMAEEALRHCDFVVRGEGELAFPALLGFYRQGGELAEIPNLSWRNEGGQVVENKMAEPIRDLDTLPFPDFSQIVGWQQAKSFGQLPIIPVQTSRGCPYGCSFCSVIPMFGRKYRFRSVKSILAELAQYRDTPHYVFFYDDNFTANLAQSKELLTRAEETPGLLTKWSAQVRVESGEDEELLSLMQNTGCSTVYIGLESANPEALKEMNKHQTVEQMRRGIQGFNAHHIDIHGMFVFGLDSDTPAALSETIRFAKKTGILSSQFIILTPFPGTPVYEDLKEQGRLTESDWSLFDGHHVVFTPKNLTQRGLQRAQMLGHAQFYSIGRTLKLLLSGSMIGTALYLYARKVNREWLHGNRVYLKALRLAERAKGFQLSFCIKWDYAEIRLQVEAASMAGRLLEQA